MTIYVDFDGTLVDVWARYYTVFCACANIETDKLELNQYRIAKLTYHRDADVCALLGLPAPTQEFWECKRELLEAPEMLACDTLLICRDRLLAWFAKVDVRLLTKRRRPEVLREQLASLGLAALWNFAVVLNPDTDDKEHWIRENAPSSSVVIGDSPEDMRAGIACGRAYFVETGLWCWEDVAGLYRKKGASYKLARLDALSALM